MEHQRPVAVDHPLGPSRRPRSVAHPGGFLFVEIGVDKILGGFRDEGLVFLHPLRHRLTGEGNDDDPFHLEPVPEFLQQGQEHVIDNQEAVPGVVGDVSDFIRVQAKVQGMEHASGGRNAEISLQMDIMIPHQGSDPVAPLEPGLLQGLGQGTRPAVKIGVSVSMHRLVRHARNYLHRSVQASRPFQKVHQRQWVVHHRSLHPVSRSRH